MSGNSRWPCKDPGLKEKHCMAPTQSLSKMRQLCAEPLQTSQLSTNDASILQPKSSKQLQQMHEYVSSTTSPLQGITTRTNELNTFSIISFFFLYCKQWHEILAVEKKGFVLPDLEEVPGTFCWMELPSPGSLEKWGFSGFILTKLSMKWNFGCTLVNFSALRATFDDLNCVTGT